MKKIMVLALMLVSTLTFSACNSTVENTPVEEIPQRIYNNLNGKTEGDNFDAGKRPIAIMIDNSQPAYPQKGTDDADIIYEMVTEGGITRLMAVYQDRERVSFVGPVRSARDEFVELMLPLNAIYVHIGTSTSAKRMLNFYSYQDIDGIYVGSKAFGFDSQLSKIKNNEHCWFTSRDLIAAGMEYEDIKTNGNFYPAFRFVEEGQPVELNGGSAISMTMSYSDYADIGFIYDATREKYKKYAYGAPHIDGLSDTQLAFDNVIIIKAKVGIEAENGVLADFDFSSGEGWYFNGGKYVNIKWEKGQPENPLILRNAETDELLFIDTGKSYVGVVDENWAGTLAIYDYETEIEPKVKNTTEEPVENNTEETEEIIEEIERTEEKSDD